LSFEIVRYSSEYQDAIVDLWRKCNLRVPQNDPVEDIRRKLVFQPELFFVALFDGKVIGSIMVGYEGHRGWLNYMAVLPEHQRRGYGRKLVEKAVDELRRRLFEGQSASPQEQRFSSRVLQASWFQR